MTDVTQILSQIEDGDPHAAEQLLVLVHNKLRRLAAQKLAREKPGQTLEATGLVHEAYLRMFGGNGQKASNNIGTIGDTSLPLRPLVLAGAFGASICV